MQLGEGETGTRHKGPDRAFHWLMALSVNLLTGTAFLPIIGIRFDWLPIHWMSGVALTVLVLFHLIRVALVHGFREMMPDGDDISEITSDLSGKAVDLPPAKYDAYQKGYHWASAITVLAVTITGLLMLVKIDTPFWRRDPSLLSDPQWGARLCHPRFCRARPSFLDHRPHLFRHSARASPSLDGDVRRPWPPILARCIP